MLVQFLPDAAMVKKLLNRVVLAARFFRATRTGMAIHQVEFDFSFLDGDRSHLMRIVGVFPDSNHQPDGLRCVPRSLPAEPAMALHQRRALVLGRGDAEAKKLRRTDPDLLEAVGTSPKHIETALSALEAPSPATLLRYIVRRAYDAAYDAYPAWAPASALCAPVGPRTTSPS